jgi:hypothetical protein
MKWMMTRRDEAAGFPYWVGRVGSPPPSVSRLQFGQLACLYRLHEDIPLGRCQLDEVAFLANAHLFVGDVDRGAVVTMRSQRYLLGHDGVSPFLGTGAVKTSKMGQALRGPWPLHAVMSRCGAPLMFSRAWILASTSASLPAARSKPRHDNLSARGE